MFYSDVARDGDTKEENTRHETHNANRRRGVTSLNRTQGILLRRLGASCLRLISNLPSRLSVHLITSAVRLYTIRVYNPPAIDKKLRSEDCALRVNFCQFYFQSCLDISVNYKIFLQEYLSLGILKQLPPHIARKTVHFRQVSFARLMTRSADKSMLHAHHLWRCIGLREVDRNIRCLMNASSLSKWLKLHRKWTICPQQDIHSREPSLQPLLTTYYSANSIYRSISYRWRITVKKIP